MYDQGYGRRALAGAWTDERLYGTPRYYLECPEDWWMLIPKELLTCVAFLGQEIGGSRYLGGTAFFVSVPLDGPESPLRRVYLVTARHCIKDESCVSRSGMFLRRNVPSGGTQDVALPEDGWYEYPEAEKTDHEDVDLIVRPWGDVEATFQAGYRWVPFTMFWTEEISDSPILGVGIGDELAAMGLFTVHSGVDRNETVVRSGHLAAVPAERVWVERFSAEMHLYLAEVHLTGGMSGAPVFARHRSMIGVPQVPISLLGVWIGHWSVDEAGSRVHSGVGMVVPAKLLATTLNQEALVRNRRRLAEEERKGRESAVLDSVERHPEEPSLTKAQWDHALRRATRRIMPTSEPERDLGTS